VQKNDGKTPPWPADQVERRKVIDLIPYAGNARTHSKAQIGQIVRSIEQYGFTTPVLIDADNSIIAGHGRVLAAEKMGLKEIPVMVARGWTDDMRKAYVILDNKLALNSDWDLALLSKEITGLGAAGFRIEGLGFSAGELAELLPAGPVALPSSGIEDAPASKYTEQ
jgi:ParB-like chromosome segregation protein Spo0J